MTTFLTIGLLLGSQPQKPAIDYQKMAENTVWRWNAEESTVWHSFLAHQQDYDLRVERMAATGDISVAFLKKDKVAFTLPAHRHTVFRIADNVVYFPRYHFSSSGATIVAVDLTTGKELWSTRLAGIGPVEHFGYSNRLNFDVGEGFLMVFGNESLGKYVEVLDRKTGKTVGHKKFAEAEKKPTLQKNGDR